MVLQGLSPVLTKLLLAEGLGREALVSARYLLAVFILLPFGVPSLRATQPAGRPRRQDWVALILVGALGSGVGALLFTAALEYSSAAVVNSISKTAPIFVAVLGTLALRERVGMDRLLLVGAMVGADVLIGFGELALNSAETRARLVGDGLALLAGLTRATSEILAKGALRRFAPSTVTLCRFAAGVSVTGLLALTTGGYRGLFALTPRGYVMLVVLAAVCTALSMYLYYRGTTEVPVHVAVSLKVLGATVTAILSWVVLRETMNLYHVAGMAVLISGGYLLVLRTAQDGAGSGTWAALQHLSDPTGHLRARLTLLVAGFTIVTVALSTALSVRHTNAMVRDQIRLTMGKVAAVLVQLAGLEDPPARHTIQQYLERVVRHRIEGELYSVEIVYIALLDGNDNLLAFALNEELSLVDEGGRPYRAGDPLAARRLLALSDSGELARQHDIIPVRAQLQTSGGQGPPLAQVEIGCKRSIANRVVAEIVARNVVLALVLLAAGVALASWLVRRVTNPLERLAAAMQRLSGGEFDLPLYSEGRGEIRQMGESLAALRDGLRTGEALHTALVQCAAMQVLARTSPAPSASYPAEPEQASFLSIEVPEALLSPDRVPTPALLEYLDGAIMTVLAADGSLVGAVDRHLVFRWSGSGEEDVLWAVVAAMNLRQALGPALRGQSLRASAVVDLTTLRDALGGALAPREETLASRLNGGEDEGLTVLVGPTAHEAVGSHLETEILPGSRLALLRGLERPDAGGELPGVQDD